MRVVAGTVHLYFRPVYCTIPGYSPAASASPSATSASTVSTADCSNPDAASLPTTPPTGDDPTQLVILPVDPKAYAQTPTIRYVLGPADLTGTAISDAVTEVSTTTSQYSVQMTLTSKGANEFDNLAAARYACYQQDPSNPPPCSEEAFELAGVVESAPDFQASSFNGNVSITGNFTQTQAQALANELKYGASNEHYEPIPGSSG